MQGFIKGISAYLSVFGLISRHRLGLFLILPGLIGMLLGVGIVYGAWNASDDLGGLVSGLYPENWWGGNIVNGVADFFGGIIVLVVGVLLFKYLLLIVVSPLMSILSEKVEKGISPSFQNRPFSIGRLMREMGRALKLNFRNILREVGLTILLTLLSFSGILAPITTVLLFFVGAYYGGFGILDYVMERHFSYKNSIAYVHQNKGLALGIGTVFMLILLIPFVGFFFAPTFATIAATKRVVESL